MSSPKAPTPSPGSTVRVSASGVDTNYIPMDAGYDLSSSDGTVENGAVILPAYSGDVTVTASGEGRSGSAVIHTVDKVDSLSISGPAGALSAVTIAPGESVQLTPKATYNHLSLFSSGQRYT